MNSLEFILLLLIKIAHLSQNFAVGWYFCYQDVVPLQRLPSHANQLVNVRNLVDNFITVGYNCVELFKSLQRLVVITKSLVDEAKVVDSLNAIRLYADSFKEELLSSVIVFTDEKTVAFVY